MYYVFMNEEECYFGAERGKTYKQEVGKMSAGCVHSGKPNK